MSSSLFYFVPSFPSVSRTSHMHFPSSRETFEGRGEEKNECRNACINESTWAALDFVLFPSFWQAFVLHHITRVTYAPPFRAVWRHSICLVMQGVTCILPWITQDPQIHSLLNTQGMINHSPTPVWAKLKRARDLSSNLRRRQRIPKLFINKIK